MSLLLKQVNRTAIDQDRLASHVLENTRSLFEGFSDAALHMMCESASNYLDQVIKQLQQKQLKNPEAVIDMITGLRVLGSAEQRDTFHIKLPTFKILATKAGGGGEVDATLAKLARNPTVKTTRDQIAQLVNNALKGDDAAIQRAATNINKLKLGYDRVQTKLENGSEEKQSSSTPTPKPVPNRASNQQQTSTGTNN